MKGAALLLLPLMACGAPQPTGEPVAASLPPMNDVAFFERIYGEELAALGLRFTRAARFEENSGKTPYTPSPTGTHLALYAEPAEPFDSGRYVTNVAPLTRVFRDVFDRWPGLTSFDICQEPIQAQDVEQREPVPVSQVRMTQLQARALDWERLDLAALIRAADRDPPGLVLFVTRRIRAHPDYERAFRMATDASPSA